MSPAPKRRRNLPRTDYFIVSTVSAEDAPPLTPDQIRAGLDVLFQPSPVLAASEVTRA